MARPYQEVYGGNISTSGTTPLVNESCYIAGIIISVSNPGTSWSIKIQDRSTPPSAIVPPTVLSATVPAQNPWVIDLIDCRPNMFGGVDLVAIGTPGVIDVWVMTTDVPSSY